MFVKHVSEQLIITITRCNFTVIALKHSSNNEDTVLWEDRSETSLIALTPADTVPDYRESQKNNAHTQMLQLDNFG